MGKPKWTYLEPGVKHCVLRLIAILRLGISMTMLPRLLTKGHTNGGRVGSTQMAGRVQPRATLARIEPMGDTEQLCSIYYSVVGFSRARARG